MRALQLRKLKKTVAYAYQHIPFYRRALDAASVHPRDIRSLADLRRLPITRRTDLESQGNDFISRAPELVAAMRFRTSGTMGKSLELFLTDDEFQYYASMQAMGGLMGGFLGPGHIIQSHLPAEASVTGLVSATAARMSGALTLQLGLHGTLDEHLKSIFEERTIPGKFPRVSTIHSAPGYLWALTARAEQLGLDGRNSGLRRIFVCGAAVSEGLKARVKKVWGLPLREAYSMVETLSTGAIECDHGRLHFLDYSGLIEFLDPKTHEPVAPGQPGIAVVTAFYPDRELMPLLRYWSEDLMIPAATTVCSCGEVGTPINDILGRADQMVVVGSQNVYPQSLGDALMVFQELAQPPRFRLRTEEHAEAHHVILDVESATALGDADKMQLAEAIKKALILGSEPHITANLVKSTVNILPAGSIQKPFGYKLQGPTPR